MACQHVDPIRRVARISVWGGGYKYCLIVVYEISFLRKLSRVMHSLYA